MYHKWIKVGPFAICSSLLIHLLCPPPPKKRMICTLSPISLGRTVIPRKKQRLCKLDGGGGVSKEFYGRKGNFDKGNVDMSYRSLPKSPILEVLMGFNHFLIKNYWTSPNMTRFSRRNAGSPKIKIIRPCLWFKENLEGIWQHLSTFWTSDPQGAADLRPSWGWCPHQCNRDGCLTNLSVQRCKCLLRLLTEDITARTSSKKLRFEKRDFC